MHRVLLAPALYAVDSFFPTQPQKTVRSVVKGCFIANATTYDPDQAWDDNLVPVIQRSQNHKLGGTVAKADLPQVLRDCINHVSGKNADVIAEHGLNLDIFLPASLLNSEVDQWSMDDGGAPIGYENRIFLRISERLEQKRAHLRPKWIRKWTQVEQMMCQAQLAREVLRPFPQQRAAAFTAQDDWLGLHWLPTKNWELFLEQSLRAVIGGAVPVALWLRQSPPRTGCKDAFDQLLDCPLSELASTVKASRQLACQQRQPERHVGHHLALVWDNPRLVPASAACASQPFDMYQEMS